tara:strand:- start:47 stop:511 length:465 start_codon:yes stop_codon:yes gene_type:complete
MATRQSPEDFMDAVTFHGSLTGNSTVHLSGSVFVTSTLSASAIETDSVTLGSSITVKNTLSASSAQFGGDVYIAGGTLYASGSAEIGGSILPARDNATDLGSSAKRWANIYTGDLHLKNERGDWSILEEKDFLCVVDNKTGKKYKMMLQPLEEE